MCGEGHLDWRDIMAARCDLPAREAAPIASRGLESVARPLELGEELHRELKVIQVPDRRPVSSYDKES